MIRHNNNIENSPLPPALVIGGIGLVRSLSKTDIPFFVGSDIAKTPILYSRHSKNKVMFSTFQTEKFIEELQTWGKSLSQKAVFLSDDDRVVLLFSRYREKLEPYFHINMPDKETVDAILDKQKFPVLAQNLDLPVPRSYLPKSVDELKKVIGDLIFPVIIKPAHKEDWWHPDFAVKVGAYRKAINCDNQDELLDYYSRIVQINPNAIIQELVPGEDFQLYSINLYIDKNYKLIANFVARKHRTFPIHAGIGCLVETIYNQEILDLSIEIAKKLRIRGFCNIQFKRDVNTDKFKIMELHTRNSVWSYLGTVSGSNITAIGYYEMVGREYPGSINFKPGVKYLDILRDVRAFFDYRIIGEWTFFNYLKSLRGTRCFILFAWNDPMPFFMDCWISFKQLLKRKLNKIDGNL